VNGLVLAGGAGRRMGADKARLPRQGWPLAVGVALALEEAGLAPILVRHAPDGLPWLTPDGRGLRVCYDEAEGRHPLWGVAAGLEAAEAGLALVVTCDLVAWTALATRRLLEVGAPWVAEDAQGRVHPLCAVFPTSWAERARELARAGAPARALVAELPRVRLPDEVLADADTPADLPDAFAAFLDGLPEGVDRARAEAGERARLLARGCVPRGR
jgi:molybdopterin-guanine dinucleotide biosynthesis protein A